MKTIKEKRIEIETEMESLLESYKKYNLLQKQLDSLVLQCDHKNAYWTGEQEDYIPMRLSQTMVYDVIKCPDCGNTWQERTINGSHVYEKSII